MTEKENSKNAYLDLLLNEDNDKLPVRWQTKQDGTHLADLAKLHPELLNQGWTTYDYEVFPTYWVRILLPLSGS